MMTDDLMEIQKNSKDIENRARGIISLLEDFQDKHAEYLQDMSKQLVHCDGSGWNGKESGWCTVFVEPTKENIIRLETSGKKLSNNETEYMAVITAMACARSGSEILSDSRLVVEQIRGNFSVNAGNLFALNEIARTLQKIKNIDLRWVPRELNLAGKHIEKVKSKKIK